MIVHADKPRKSGPEKTSPFRTELISFIAGIPQKHVVRAGRILGTFAYILDTRHRRIVKRNLRFTHPGWSVGQIRVLSKGVFQNLGITVLEILQMRFLSRDEVLAAVRISGKENLFTALKNPKGAIMISAHLGNWEMAHIFFSCYLETPLALVARRVRPRALNEWLQRFRTRFGSLLWDKDGALPKMARMLRRGRMVGLLIDQGTLWSEGVEVVFFEKKTFATPAAAILARRLDSPVIPAFCVRESDGKLTLFVEPPLSLRKSDDMRSDIKINTQIMTDAIERAVKAHPEQWFWFHKRWKRHYPFLYPEDLARRRRQTEKENARLRRKMVGSVNVD